MIPRCLHGSLGIIVQAFGPSIKSKKRTFSGVLFGIFMDGP